MSQGKNTKVYFWLWSIFVLGMTSHSFGVLYASFCLCADPVIILEFSSAKSCSHHHIQLHASGHFWIFKFWVAHNFHILRILRFCSICPHSFGNILQFVQWEYMDRCIIKDVLVVKTIDYGMLIYIGQNLEAQCKVNLDYRFDHKYVNSMKDVRSLHLHALSVVHRIEIFMIL